MDVIKMKNSMDGPQNSFYTWGWGGGVCEPQKQVEAKIQNETEKIYRLKHVRRRP